jgi:probable HAF family extracellular repeat protein
MPSDSSRKYLKAAVGLILLAASCNWAKAEYDYIAIDLTPSNETFCGAYGVNGSQQVGRGKASSDYHALLWSGTAASAVDLTPPGFTYSVATATNGSQQVGWGYSPTTGLADQALLWNGTADSAVNLNPSGFTNSYTNGIAGSQQVGYGIGVPNASHSHALLWSGTAASAIDLNPINFLSFSSVACATNGVQQVGCFNTFSGGPNYAVLWTGTATSAVNLNPSGYLSSCAYGISGSQQVGYGNGVGSHALLWSGSPDSVIDLNPDGFSFSIAEATNGWQQVGFGSALVTGNRSHALLWSGSAGTAIDLHQYLPSGIIDSRAMGIDAQGNVVGYGSDASGNTHAFLWRVAPEPSTFALGIVAAVTFCLLHFWRRRRVAQPSLS